MSAPRRDFVVEIGSLLRAPGSKRRVRVAAPIEGLAVTGSQVPADEPVEVDVVLEAANGRVLATGTVAAPYVGSCRRCLEPVTGRVTTSVRELFARGGDGDEAYPMTAEELDLEPLAHDAIILELPLALLCEEGCLGLCPECGANRNVEPCKCLPEIDPRWGALSVLAGDPDHPDARRRGHKSRESDNGRPEEEDLEVEEPEPARLGLDAERAAAERVPAVQEGEAPSRGVPKLRLVQGSAGDRGRLTS
jgi:uncharacterized protein